jgi:hypothetical protein
LGLFIKKNLGRQVLPTNASKASKTVLTHIDKINICIGQTEFFIGQKTIDILVSFRMKFCTNKKIFDLQGKILQTVKIQQIVE